jgi:hypothetical protein
MKTTIFLLTLVTLTLWSCQKEISYTGGPVTIIKDSLVTRTVARSGADSTTDAYTYDANKRLTLQQTTSTDPNYIEEDRKIVRNAQGIIQKIIYSSDEYRLMGVDSVIFNVSSTGGRYQNKTSTVSLPGWVMKDSTVYTYNTSGFITMAETFRQLNGNGYGPAEKLEYTYSRDTNVLTEKMWVYDAGSYQWFYTYTNEYNNGINPLYFGNEAMLLENGTYSRHLGSRAVQEYDDTVWNETIQMSYTFNTINKPQTALWSLQNSGTNYAITFYYE